MSAFGVTIEGQEHDVPSAGADSPLTLAIEAAHSKAGTVVIRPRQCRVCDLTVYTTEMIRAVQETLLKR